MTNNATSELSEIGSYRCPSNREHDHSTKSSSRHAKEFFIQPDVLMVMRHSERLDDCCPGWIEKCAKRGGKYDVFDLNQPSKLPIQRAVGDFANDTCLTRSGVVLAQMVGRSLSVVDNTPDVIYCSPSLRCIQTATWVREMSAATAEIRVEPGLFEDFKYPNGVPKFLTPSQRLTFPVDQGYRPIRALETIINHQESNEEYNERLRVVLQEIVKTFENVVGREQLRVLVVAHASTVDMSVGLLRERPRRTTSAELESIAITVPYCSLAYLKKKKNNWVPMHNAIPTVTYENLNNRYNPYYVHRQ